MRLRRAVNTQRMQHDLAMPTYFNVRVLLMLFALVVACPAVTASRTRTESEREHRLSYAVLKLGKKPPQAKGDAA